MALPVGFKGIPKFLLQFMDPKQEQRRTKTLKRLACIEVILKPKTSQSGKTDREYEMILKRTLQIICILTLNPNTTTSVIIQVVNDDGAVSFKIIHFAEIKTIEYGIITSVTKGAMSVDDYLNCLKRGLAATAAMSASLRKSLQLKLPN